MRYQRMPIEIESPESLGYDSIECNLAESSVRDVQFKDIGCELQDLTICYGDHVGKPALRELIAADYPGISADDILLTVGAAGALFIIQTSLLEPGDHLIVVRPNYATNIETPRAIGVSITFIDLTFENNYALSTQQVVDALRPNTKLISITNPHNPTGTVVPADTVQSLCAVAEKKGCYLLVDETYRALSFETMAPLTASISRHAISVSSLSKAFGIPGIRIGWIISQDPALQHLFLAAKEQIHICNSVVDEEIAYQYLLKRADYFPGIRTRIAECFAALKEWMWHHDALEWIEPEGGVVGFPRFKKAIAIDTETFYRVLLDDFKTYVGPGHWFEQSDRSFRLGFGWEIKDSFLLGLKNIDEAIALSLIG